MRVTPASSTEQLDLNFGDAQSRQERESKPRDSGKAATVSISDEAKKAIAEVGKISKEVRSEPKYTGKAYSDTGPRTGSTSGGFGGAGDTKFLKPKYKAGGTVSSASKRADGCCVKGKTRGKML
jgi:hypothetical protein